MATLEQLTKQRDDLNVRIEHFVLRGREKIFNDIRDMMLEAGITMQDLNEHAKHNGHSTHPPGSSAPRSAIKGKLFASKKVKQLLDDAAAKAKRYPKRKHATSKPKPAKGTPKFIEHATGKTWTGIGRRPVWYLAAERDGRLAEVTIEKQAA